MEGKLIFKTEEEMQKELQERIDNYKSGYSRDGYVVRASGKFNYRGILYLINVLRYYNHTNRFTPMGQSISDSFANVEYPDETKLIVDIIPNDYSYEFLYHDTNHAYNENQTVEEKIKECHKLAKEDIDSLLDGKISKEIDKGIQKLQEVKDNLNKKIKEFALHEKPEVKG